MRLRNSREAAAIPEKEEEMPLLLPVAILAMETGPDRDFMEELYRNNALLMYRTAKRHGAEGANADDVVSQSVEKLIKVEHLLRELDPKRRRAYLVAVVRNTARNDARNRRNRRELPDGDAALENCADEGADLWDALLRRCDLDLLRAAMATLSEGDRVLLRMRYYQNQNYAEIAEELGISEGAARTRLSRVLARLRKKYEELQKDGE